MKQLIVLVSMIMLGVAISGIISQFGDSASDMGSRAISQMDSIAVTQTQTSQTSGE